MGFSKEKGYFLGTNHLHVYLFIYLFCFVCGGRGGGGGVGGVSLSKFIFFCSFLSIKIL